MTQLSRQPDGLGPMWTNLLSITCEPRAAGVRLMVWRSREVADGECLLVYSPQATERWRRMADLLICEGSQVPADEQAEAMLNRLPGCLLVATEDTGCLGAVLRTRDGQRDVVPETGHDLERRAVLAYAWITAGRALTTVP
jgi:hypothetical protein